MNGTSSQAVWYAVLVFTVIPEYDTLTLNPGATYDVYCGQRLPLLLRVSLGAVRRILKHPTSSSVSSKPNLVPQSVWRVYSESGLA